jgi:hypothetical protein
VGQQCCFPVWCCVSLKLSIARFALGEEGWWFGGGGGVREVVHSLTFGSVSPPSLDGQGWQAVSCVCVGMKMVMWLVPFTDLHTRPRLFFCMASWDGVHVCGRSHTFEELDISIRLRSLRHRSLLTCADYARTLLSCHDECGRGGRGEGCRDGEGTLSVLCAVPGAPLCS